MNQVIVLLLQAWLRGHEKAVAAKKNVMNQVVVLLLQGPEKAVAAKKNDEPGCCFAAANLHAWSWKGGRGKEK